MSLDRPIWNDGQGVATPDLQRSCTDVGAVDDRVFEAILTPGITQKKIAPLIEEAAGINPHLLAIPSPTAGAVRMQPAELVAGAPGGTALAQQQVSLAANVQAPIDSALIAANSSGVTRYDLVYATLNRSVVATGTRKIKSAVDGSLSSQNVNLADAPAVTLGIVQGFLTGATPPTLAQIAAALPADTNPSSSTFGSFNFAVAVVTVANGYASAGTIFQNANGGTTYLSQAWFGGFLQSSRVRLARYGSLVDKASGTLGQATTPIGGGRFCNVSRMFVPVIVTATSQTITLDDVIDWRQRIVKIWAIRCATTGANTAGRAWENPNAIPTAGGSGSVQLQTGPFFTMGTAQAYGQVFGQDATPYWQFRVNTGNVLQALYQTQALASGTAASDVWWFDIDYTDQLIF